MAGPRILVTALGHIGDTLAATPVTAALRAAMPDARITVLILDTVAPLWRGRPEVDALLTMPDRQHGGMRGRAERLWLIARLLPRLWRRFDQVLVLQSSGAANLIALLTGAPVRAGFGRGPARRLLTVAVPATEGLSMREANLSVVQALGIASHDPRLRLAPGMADGAMPGAVLRRLGLDGGGPLIGLHPGSDWGCQMWGYSRWAQTGDALARRWGARLVITGTAGERWIAERIAAQMTCQPVIACGETTLTELAALIGRMDLLVGVESGPVVLAAAAGTPAVALEALYYDFERPPWGRLPGDERIVQILERDRGQDRWFGDCRLAKLKRERGCVNPACIGQGVMGRIEPEAVVQAADALLATVREPAGAGMRREEG